MAIKLTREQSANLSRFVEDLALAGQAIDEAVSAYNTSVNDLRGPIEVAVTEYNEILSQVRSLRDDITVTAQNAIDTKSEKWQESDAGVAASEFAEAWEGISIDDIDFEWPVDLEIDVPSYDSDLDELPQEAEA